MPRSQLFNSPNTCVDEALAGLEKLSNGSLTLVQSRIIARSSIDKSKVALVSLGGSGHEPAHAGFVGSGMLTAAVAGNVFASPPPADIVTALAHVGGSGGVLLIIKNYTGDIVNAEIAKQQAEDQYSLTVQILVCKDDCATKNTSLGARGLAGTVFLHKILGGMAESGCTLEEIARHGVSLVQRIATMGLSFNTCALPGALQPSKSIAVGSAELGLGIHGESGVKQLDVAPTSNEAANLLLESVLAGRDLRELALLINNLGGLSTLEMLVFSNDILSESAKRGCNVKFVCAGTMMSSLDSAGVSVSILEKVSNAECIHLQGWTNAIGWPMSASSRMLDASVAVQATPRASVVASRSKRQMLHNVGVALDEKLIPGLLQASKVMQESHIVSKLNSLDAIAGDGDTGASLSRTASIFQQELANHDGIRTSSALLELALDVCERTGGSFGGMMALFFGGATRFKPDEAFSWETAWNQAKQALSSKGGAKLGDRSMVDALFPAVENVTSYADAAHAARQGADATAAMIAKVGRACYVPQDKYLNHYNDAGAEAIAIFLQALSEKLQE